VTLHIAAATIYSLVGAFQFDSDLRRRWPMLHRVLGRATVVGGIVVGLTGLWMTLASAIPLGLQGDLLRIVRVAVALGMVAALVLGVTAIRAGRVRRHLAWMARALCQRVGTGHPRQMAAWLLNVGLVEWVLRRPASVPPERLAAGSRRPAQALKGLS
jgi:uncharacterized membrane protein